jgi:hypothetical protein
MINIQTIHAPGKALAQVLSLYDSEWAYADSPETVGCENVFMYSASFARLWGFDHIDSKPKVALLWNERPLDVPMGTVDLEPHLSPLAWATCALKSRRELEVVILDVARKDHRAKGRLYSFIEAVQPEKMPWLRVVSLSEFGRFLVRQFVEPQPKEMAGEADGREKLLGLLSQQVRDELSAEGKENNRHAIQNIVGPLVLLGREYLNGRGIAERALLHVFEAAGLLSEEHGRRQPLPKTIEEESWGPQSFRLLLIDDQADYGWADWMRSKLPTCKPELVTLDVIKEPEDLLDRLIVEWGALGKARDRRFELQLPAQGERAGSEQGSPNERQSVFLLDLRLHSMRSVENEAAFFKQLLPLCERFKTGDEAPAFAWPGFSPKELQAVHSWCAKPKRESDEHFVALSLLPRLLALLDMSLPIIIFSSTGQRSIIEKFKPYRNIITDFEKPRFFGRDSQNVVKETHAKFGQAIQRAAQLAEGRRLCRQMLQNIKRAKTSPIPSSSAKTNTRWNAVLYIDESGDKRDLTLAGLLLLTPEGVTEDQIDKSLRKAFETPGDQARPPAGPSRSKGWCHNVGNLNKLFRHLQEKFPTARLCLITLTAGRDRIFDSFDENDELHDERVADNLWREIFRRLVEASIYALPQALIGSGGELQQFSVRAPTRVLPTTAIGADSRQLRALFNRWGIDVSGVGKDAALWEALSTIQSLPPPSQMKPSRWRWLLKVISSLRPTKKPEEVIRYFGFDSPRPIVEEIMRLYRNADHPPLADIIRGFLLNCHGKAASAHVPILHFAVDGLLYQGNFKKLGSLTTIAGAYGRNLEVLLEVNRCHASGERTEALLTGSTAEYRPDDGLQQVIWTKLEDVLKQATGNELAAFSERVASNRDLPGVPQLTFRGKVIRRGQSGYWGIIEDEKGKQFFAPTCPANAGETVTFTPVRDRCPGQLIAFSVQKTHSHA